MTLRLNYYLYKHKIPYKILTVQFNVLIEATHGLKKVTFDKTEIFEILQICDKDQ